MLGSAVAASLTHEHSRLLLQQNITSQLRQWRDLALADSRRCSQHELRNRMVWFARTASTVIVGHRCLGTGCRSTTWDVRPTVGNTSGIVPTCNRVPSPGPVRSRLHTPRPDGPTTFSSGSGNSWWVPWSSSAQEFMTHVEGVWLMWRLTLEKPLILFSTLVGRRPTIHAVWPADTLPSSQSTPWPFQTCFIVFLIFQSLELNTMGAKDK